MDNIQDDNESIFQEKYKVPRTPYKKVDNEIDQLDTILNILLDAQDNLDFEEIRYKLKFLKLDISDFDLQLAIDKLILDKYVVNPKSGSNQADSFYITYHGRLFLRKTSKKYSNKPYRYSIAIQRRSDMYAKAKIAANIANTLIIIIIGVWGVYVADKTTQLEEKVEKTEKLHRLQVDSLTRIINDTTRVRK